ncbi:MAG: Gfo/Idh/MocA family protein [Mesonia sp.]|uniref:Gfo/Idh/MocA family protein n=1 Tax=Mesonia sp. TaxID=1960830 RepID=UPI003F98F612
MSNRRSFLKNMTLASGALASGSLLTSCGSEERFAKIKAAANHQPEMHFNMSGYAAPALDTVRIGIVGIGDRGAGAVERMTFIDGVEITALCDKRQAAVDGGQKILQEAGLPKAAEFTNSETAFKEMCQSDLVDLVYVVTSWEWHIPIALEAMENDKHTAVEVSTARTIEECWQIVETSERTKKHCVILENCCYDFFELLTLNMVRQGVFGDLIHGEGAYIHNLDYWMLREPEDDKMVDGAYTDFWRIKENKRHANVYPTHGLGPICQAMNINRGDKMEYLTAMMSDDFNFSKNIKKLAKENPVFEQFKDWDLRGNMDIQLIRTHKGRTIMLQHDVTSPRPYSRIHMLSGTKCFAQKWPLKHIAFGHDVADADKMKELEEKYTPEILKRVGEMAKKVGGHGGMDFIMDWRLIDCLRNGLPMDMDVYDAASWSSITSLSEWSIANKSNSIDVPDFTRGAWKTNKPVDMSLAGGGTTGVRNINREKSGKQLSTE